MPPRVPPYFDLLIPGFERGQCGRFVHLGYWDQPPPANALIGPDDFAKAQERLNDVLLNMADLRDGQTILDVGCGFGGTIESIDRRQRGMYLIGVNIDPRQLAICRQLQPRSGNRMEWLEADACQLPLPAAGVDRVLCFEAMFHFPSRQRFYQEAARVLKPGGLLVVSDILLQHDDADASTPSRQEIESVLRGAYAPWPDPWCSEGPPSALAAAAGLKIVQERDLTGETLPSHRFTAPAGVTIQEASGDPFLRAAVMLRWVQETGWGRYVCTTLAKGA